eukprot:CAMPEP_0171187354 /NCGR_PEP_ID=MMETSP0790-20130122/17278_1 /TAXON_ID=2925 /ORGANISM="Alexandrium catenella, Strain OF101" /LENGTH=353 /DNA_ID=CAMNT_0011652413 /DNA_START=50 /DNA_END=1108 /DNA_ORIENTATION=+
MTAALKDEVDEIVKKIGDKKDGQAALEDLGKFAADKGSKAQAFLVAAYDKVLEATGDKSKNVKDAAVATAKAILQCLSPYALEALLPSLLASLAVKARPPQKEAALQIIAHVASIGPKAIGFKLVDLVAPVAELTCDIKKEVKVAATECMTAICACTGNKDLDPFLDAVVEAAQSIDKTHRCVERLAGCVFVQNVETPALAIMMPVLTRGLHDKSEKVKRTCCLIVDNMCKVVEDPAAVVPVMSLLEPLVKSATEQISDPEARSVADRALKTLMKAAEGAESKMVSKEAASATLKAAVGDKLGSDDAAECLLGYVATLASMATNMRCFEDWQKTVGFVEPFSSVIEDVRAKME